MRKTSRTLTTIRRNAARVAADTGKGWDWLAQKWGMTRPGALQWCRNYVDPDIAQRIGVNGRAAARERQYKAHYRVMIMQLRDEELLTFQKISERMKLHIWRVHSIYWEVKRMSSPSKPKSDIVPKPPAPPNQHCHKMTYTDGVLRRCGEPTEGKTYCPACAHGLVAMFDPTPKHTPTQERAA